MIIELTISATAVAIGIQDFRERQVYWFLFPLLFLFGLIYTSCDLRRIAINLIVISLLIGMIILYLKIIHRTSNIANYIGLGDILLLISIIPFFHFQAYLIFLSFSGLLCITCFGIISIRQKNYPIPLAGFQSLCLVPIILFKHFNWLDLNSIDPLIW